VGIAQTTTEIEKEEQGEKGKRTREAEEIGTTRRKNPTVERNDAEATATSRARRLPNT
jgi:hypothetical protein